MQASIEHSDHQHRIKNTSFPFLLLAVTFRGSCSFDLAVRFSTSCGFLRLHFQLLAFRKFLRANHINTSVLLQRLAAACVSLRLYCTLLHNHIIFLLIYSLMQCFQVLAFIFMYLYGGGFHSYVFPNKIPLSQVSTFLLKFRLESNFKRSQSLVIPVGKYLFQNIRNIPIYHKPKLKNDHS